MKIAEFESTVDQYGNLIITKEDLAEMHISAGDKVSIAYIASEDDLITNSFREFLITCEGIHTLKDEQVTGIICIPDNLLHAAGIGQESDVIVNCGDQTITIQAIDSLNSLDDEMGQVSDAIRIIKGALENA